MAVSGRTGWERRHRRLVLPEAVDGAAGLGYGRIAALQEQRLLHKVESVQKVRRFVNVAVD
jgi:hypothetical protein